MAVKGWLQRAETLLLYEMVSERLLTASKQGEGWRPSLQGQTRSANRLIKSSAD